MMFRTILLLMLLACTTASAHAQISPFFSADNNKYGYKDQKGKTVVEPKYDLAYELKEDMAAVVENGKYGFVDAKGLQVVASHYDYAWRFIGGYAAVRQNGKFGFIDKTGKLVTPLVYDNAYNYHGACCYKGQAHVKQNGQWKIIRIAP